MRPRPVGLRFSFVGVGFALTVAFGVSAAAPASAVAEDELTRSVEVLKLTQLSGGGVLVEDTLAIANPTNETYADPLTLYVPRGATDLEWRFATIGKGGSVSSPHDEFAVAGTEGDHDLVALDIAAHNATVPGGNVSHLTVSYRVPGSAFTMRFAHDADNVVVQVFSRPGQMPESEELSFSRLERAESAWLADGSTIRSADAGDTFALRFVVAPADLDAGPGSVRDNWKWVGLGALAGGFFVGALVKGGILRIAPASSRAQSGRPPLAEVARETLEARRRILMAALKELDMGHRAGEIPATVHSPLKAEFMDEAVRVVKELERRAAEAAASAATPEANP